MNPQFNYIPFNKYILRTPLLSLNVVSNLDIYKIRELCSESIISEAIYLASPELYNEMIKYLAREHEPTDEKLVFALLKYLIRMGTRSTPFGLFSGVSIGEIEEKTNISLQKVQEYKRVTRLDMNFLCSLSLNLESNKEIRNELKYYPNSSLYKIGNQFRYVEFQYVNSIRKHFLMAIDASDFLVNLFKKCENGLKIEDLIKFIIDDEITKEDALDFVHELIDSQILTSSIYPTVTGKNYFDIIKDNVSNENMLPLLEEISLKVNELDKDIDIFNLNSYNEIIELTKKFEIEVNKKFLFQTDLYVNTHSNVLGNQIIDNVVEGLNILNLISNKKEYKKLENFKRKFYQRFEEEEVPLTLALDVETGVGFGEENEDADSYSYSDLIDDLPHSSESFDKVNFTQKINQTKLDRILIKKLFECFKSKNDIIELNENDLLDFNSSWDEAPNTFSTIIRIYEEDSKPLFYMSGFGGTTGTYLLSRFSHVDEKIYDYIEEILNKEIEDDIIYAEIVHLPEARTGNVLSRLNLRKYEIPYLANSALPKENQIPIDDIMVSIRNGRIYLRSKKENKQVFPLLSNAHNTEADPLPIYSFLTELQAQDKREHFGFKWGDTLTNEAYLPRVMYKNIIFSLATWKISKKELNNIKDKETLNKWLFEKNIPEKVTISDLDNNLMIDFKNELSCKMFISIIKNREYLILKEFLYNKNKSLINRDGEGFSNEFVLSFYKN